MVAETMCELLCRHGLMLAQLDQEGMPELDGGDEFQSTFQRVTLVLGQAYTAGTGTLHTTSRNIFWCSRSGDVAYVPFRAITMHAMSDDTAVHERPCVYCQLDSPDAIDALEERCDLGSNELLLVPDDEADVKLVFEALCKGAEANPDEMEEDEGDFFFDAQAMQQGLDQGDHDHLDGMVEHLELGSPPLSEVQASGYAATSHPPPAPEDSVKDGKQQ